MTGAEHYKQAEVLVEAARQLGLKAPQLAEAFAEAGVAYDAPAAMSAVLAEAQVHATLALAAATALNIRRNGSFPLDVEALDAWESAIGGGS